jgi:hypothetical protein
LFEVAIPLSAIRLQGVAADPDILAGLLIRAIRRAILVISTTLVTALPVAVPIPISISVAVAVVIASTIAATAKRSAVVHDSTIATAVITKRGPVPLAVPGLAIGFQRISMRANVAARLDVRPTRSTILSVPAVPVAIITIAVPAPVSIVAVVITGAAVTAEISIVIHNIVPAALEIYLAISPVAISILAGGVQCRSIYAYISAGLLIRARRESLCGEGCSRIPESHGDERYHSKSYYVAHRCYLLVPKVVADTQSKFRQMPLKDSVIARLQGKLSGKPDQSATQFARIVVSIE